MSVRRSAQLLLAAVAVCLALLAPSACLAQSWVMGRDACTGYAKLIGVGPFGMAQVSSNPDPPTTNCTATPWTFTIWASSAETASFNTPVLTLYDARGAEFFFNVSAVSGTSPTLACQLQGKDLISGNWVNEPGAVTASITATGTSLLTVAPRVNNVANSNIADLMPQTSRFACALGGTTPSFTLSISAVFVH